MSSSPNLLLSSDIVVNFDILITVGAAPHPQPEPRAHRLPCAGSSSSAACWADRTAMRTFVRNKKLRPADGAEAAAAASGGASSPVKAQKPALEQRGQQVGKGDRGGQSAAHGAQPDPYAFDMGDDLAAPGEGSQHDPAFLELLVARTSASLDGDDASVHSASPPERKAGRGPYTFKGALARLTGSFPKLKRFVLITTDRKSGAMR